MRNKYLEFYNASFGSGEHCTKSWGLASFQAGAQSRQEEIDELKKRINQLEQEKLDHANKLDKIFYGEVK